MTKLTVQEEVETKKIANGRSRKIHRTTTEIQKISKDNTAVFETCIFSNGLQSRGDQAGVTYYDRPLAILYTVPVT